MKQVTLLFVLAFVATMACQAQGKYQISGKINGVADGTLLLVRNDGTVPDTLATASLKNGVFMLSGEIDGPAGSYLATADGGLQVPLIVEPTNIMLNVSERGALIQGGGAAKAIRSLQPNRAGVCRRAGAVAGAAMRGGRGRPASPD